MFQLIILYFVQQQELQTVHMPCTILKAPLFSYKPIIYLYLNCLLYLSFYLFGIFLNFECF